MRLKNSKNRGYLLIEMVIYVSLLTIIFIVAINMLLSFSQSYRTLSALRLAEHSAVDSLERISRDIRLASSVDSGNSTLGTSPGVLTLIATSNGVSTTTKFYVQNGVLKVDVPSEAIMKLTDEASLKDSIGNPLIKVKEGSLEVKRLINFMHNEHEYVLNADGVMVKKE